jgi:hypothetical protein
VRDFLRRLFNFGRPIALVGVVGFAAIATLPAAILIAFSQAIAVPIPMAAMLGIALS